MIYPEEAMMRWRRCRKQLALAILASSITAVVFLFNRKENVKESHKGLNLSNFQAGMISGQTGKGFLNLAIWEEICGHEMQSLKEFPLFPHGPTSRLLISKFRLRFTQEFTDFGLRIFGFLRPNESGNYSFCLSSIMNGTSELWISSDSKPENSKLITNTTDGLTNCYDNKNRIQLVAGDIYFLEFLHKHGLHDDEKKVNEIYVKWRSSSWEERELREIPSNVLFAEINKSKGVRTLNQYPTFVLPMHVQRRSPRFVNEEVERRSQMYSLPFINESDSRDLFPPFSYNPSYLVKGPLRRYQSTWEMHYTSIYPFDHGDILWKERGDFLSFGNDRLDDDIAQAVVSQVWTQIKKRHSRKYSFVQTLNVEENHDQGTGDRYLVELELKEISGGKSVRFSEYVYRPWGAHTLCTPVGVAWNKSAVINILLTTGNNQGRWILHFLDNMARIYDRTKDTNFNVVIVDFDSKDIDVENALKKAAIPSYQYANMEGNFSRALGLQKAAEMVRDPNSIIFAMDLHLDIPYHFLDDVRKHCVQHKIAYSPILIRLDCGATPSQPFGRWEIHGLGLIGLYKSDWDKAGGMNIEEFKDKWGGEDWELSDRILEAGMEIERLKMMHFFHYFHSKKGMWNTMNDQLKHSKTLV